MVCFKGFWRGNWACAAGAVLALLALGCGGKHSSHITVSGTVTYTRRALTKDANGVPTGLSTTYSAAQIARGVKVRAIEAVDETMSDGSTQTAYLIAGSTYTDENGTYSLSVPKNTRCFVEVQSIAGTGSTKPVRILSDANTDLTQISAGTAAADCTLYSLRKALDGSSSESNPVLATAASGNVSVNFAVTGTTKWWIAASPIELVKNATLESAATGSRVLGIIDSMYTFMYVYGDPTPGAALDLFYRPTMHDDARGTFVDSSDAYRYYGSIRGMENDDAWDESIIIMLCARNALYSHTAVSPYYPPSDQLPLDATGLARKTGLDPVHALIDGLPYGIAADLLQTPYLADTNGTSLAALRDIRDISNLECNAYSAPGIGALSWSLLLKANGLSDTYSAWSSIDTDGMTRFFSLTIPADSNGRPTDTASIYKQLLRLQEGKSASSDIDLASTFTDTVLTSMVSPYGLAWPRPAAESSYLLDWGTDPDTSASGSFIINMGMDSAHADASGTFPNYSKGEIAHAKFLLSKDTLYTFSIAISPALVSGAKLEVKVLDASGQYQDFYLTGSGGLASDSLMLDGDGTTSKYIPVHFRLLTGSLTTALGARTLTITLVPRAE